jgi:hypothetical protein
MSNQRRWTPALVDALIGLSSSIIVYFACSKHLGVGHRRRHVMTATRESTAVDDRPGAPGRLEPDTPAPIHWANVESF